MRPKRFSNPSIYLALDKSVHHPVVSKSSHGSPLWRVALLFHLSEYTFRLVVLTVRAGGHLAVTLYLLLPTHITRLPPFDQHLCLFPLAV